MIIEDNSNGFIECTKEQYIKYKKNTSKYEVKVQNGKFYYKEKSTPANTDCLTEDGWLGKTGSRVDFVDSRTGTEYEVKQCSDGNYYKRVKQSPVTPTELPEWLTADGASCLNKYVTDNNKTLVTTNKPGGLQVKLDYDSNKEWYFEPNSDFMYKEKDSGGEWLGTWNCDSGGDVLILYTPLDNTEWRSDGDGKWKKRGSTPTPVDCAPFKDKGEADKFRGWVNENYPEIAANIPGLPNDLDDKKLSTKGKCNSVHIQTAANHKINGKKLIDLFRNGEVIVQEKNPNEERNNWMGKNEASFSDGEMKEYPIGGFPLKIYEKIIDGRGFRFFPPKNGNKPMYIEYTDGTFSTPEFKGPYSLSIEESLNKSIKRWLDIMNKNGRPSINEQILGPREPYLTGRQAQDAELKKKKDEESKAKQIELDKKKTDYKNNLERTHGLSLTADNIEVNLGKYDVIDLNSDKIYGNPSLFTEPGKDFVYKQKGEVTIEKPQQAQIIKKYADKGYKEVPCNTSQTNDILFFVKLHEKHPTIFTTPYCMSVKATFTGTAQEFNSYIETNYEELKNPITVKKTCRELINMYKNASDKKYPVQSEVSIDIAKQYITRCKTQHKFHFATDNSLDNIWASRKKRVGIYGFRD